MSASAVMLLNPSATRLEPGATFNKTLYHMTAAALHDAGPTEARPLVRVHDRDTVLYSQYGIVAAARANTHAPQEHQDAAYFDALAVGKVFRMKSSSTSSTSSSNSSNSSAGGTPPRGRGRRRRGPQGERAYQVAPLAECANPFARFGVAVGVCADVAAQRHYAHAAAAALGTAAGAAPYVAYLDTLPRLLHGAAPLPGDRAACAAAAAPPTTAALLHPPRALAAAYAQCVHVAPAPPAWLVRGATLADPSLVAPGAAGGDVAAQN